VGEFLDDEEVVSTPEDVVTIEVDPLAAEENRVA